jgi:TRAP-type C4-dicarboxylate transport system permease small subunit
MASAAGIRERTHLAVDIVPMLCSPRIKIALRLLCDLILCGFGVFMALMSVGLLEFSWNREIPLLGIPDGVRYIPVIISGALVAIFSAASSLSGAIYLFSNSDEVFRSNLSKQKNKTED